MLSSQSTHSRFSSRSDEAVDAYIKALEIKPNYVRALANLGIAYSNQVGMIIIITIIMMIMITITILMMI